MANHLFNQWLTIIHYSTLIDGWLTIINHQPLLTRPWPASTHQNFPSPGPRPQRLHRADVRSGQWQRGAPPPVPGGSSATVMKINGGVVGRSNPGYWLCLIWLVNGWTMGYLMGIQWFSMVIKIWKMGYSIVDDGSEELVKMIEWLVNDWTLVME